MEFSLKLSAGFLKKSYARRMFYDLWKLGVAYVAVLVALCSQWDDAGFSGWRIFFLTLVVLSMAIFAVAWFQQSRRLDDWARSQGDAPVIYAFSDAGVESTSRIGSTKLSWSAFAGLTITDFDTVLKPPHRGGELTLDTAQVPRDAIEHLKSRFQAHGKKVEDKRKPA